MHEQRSLLEPEGRDGWSEDELKRVSRRTIFSLADLRAIRERRRYIWACHGDKCDAPFAPIECAILAAKRNITLEHAAQVLEQLRRE